MSKNFKETEKCKNPFEWLDFEDTCKDYASLINLFKERYREKYKS